MTFFVILAIIGMLPIRKLLEPLFGEEFVELADENPITVEQDYDWGELVDVRVVSDNRQVDHIPF